MKWSLKGANGNTSRIQHCTVKSGVEKKMQYFTWFGNLEKINLVQQNQNNFYNDESMVCQLTVITIGELIKSLDRGELGPWRRHGDTLLSPTGKNQTVRGEIKLPEFVQGFFPKVPTRSDAIGNLLFWMSCWKLWKFQNVHSYFSPLTKTPKCQVVCWWK